MALPFDRIAEQIGQIGRGQLQPIVALPGGVAFATDYSITGRAGALAFSKAIARANLAAAEMRQLDTERYEDLYRALQRGIMDGSATHVTAGVLEKMAKLNGYIAPAKVEAAGKDGDALIPIEALRRLQSEADAEEERWK